MCGGKLSDDAQFCPYCGTKREQTERVNSAQTAPQTPQAAPQAAQAAPQAPQAAPQAPQAVPQAPQAVPQMAQAVPQAPQAAPQEPQAVPQEPQAVPQMAQAAPDGQQDAPTGSGESYYSAEFARIRQGQEPSFNRAACILGFWHTLYRGCWGRFFALYSWLGVFTAVTGGMMTYKARTATEMTLVFHTWGWGTAWTVAFCLALLMQVIVAVYNGYTFNGYLYRRCHGDVRAIWQSDAGLTIGVCTGGVAAVMLAIVFCVNVVIGAQNAAQMRQDIAYYAAQGGPAWQESEDMEECMSMQMHQIISQPPSEEDPGMFLSGRAMGLPGSGIHSDEDMEFVGENARFLCNTQITLGQVLRAATDAHEWKFLQQDESGDYSGQLRCYLGNSVIEFYVLVGKGEGGNAVYMAIGAPMFYLTDEELFIKPYYIGTQEQAAAFMQWAYQVAQ